MRFLSEIGQVFIALGFSGAIAVWLGPGPYMAVALFVLATTWLLMFDAARRERRFALTEGLIALFVAMGGTAIVFATIWPALPPILAWGAWRRRGDGEDAIERRDSR